MASRAAEKQLTESTDSDKSAALPLWDGTHLTGLPWLRELEANEHLFDSDVAYFLRTAAVVSSAAKTAVSSAEHSALLKHNIILKQNYSVRNPPPDDNFVGLYAEIRSKIAAGEAGFTSQQVKDAFPDQAPAALPDTHILSPDRIMVTDLKLRNALLALILLRAVAKFITSNLHNRELLCSTNLSRILSQALESTPKARIHFSLKHSWHNL